MSPWLPGSTVAFIGTRELDAVALTLRHLFISAATYAGAHDVIVTAGAAKGADQAAANAALLAGGRVRLVLPWSNYESAWVTLAQRTFRDHVEVVVYTPAQHKEWLENVFAHHPDGINVPKVEDIPRHLREQIRADASAIIAPQGPAEVPQNAPSTTVDDTLSDLIAHAARAQGYQGPDPVGHWLSLNYLTSKIEELTEAERADAHARAQSVLDTQAAPAAAAVTEPATPAAATETTVPAPAEPVSTPAGDDEPLTPEEATALRRLLAQAAAAEGLTGKGATLKWVDTHFGISGKKLEDVPGSVRTQMRETAIKILEQHEAATRDKTSTTTAPAAAAPATPALPDSPHTQRATPEQLDAIRQECATRGIVNPATEPIITWAVKTKFETLEDLTAAQADRVLRALRYNTRGQRSTTPA